MKLHYKSRYLWNRYGLSDGSHRYIDNGLHYTVRWDLGLAVCVFGFKVRCRRGADLRLEEDFQLESGVTRKGGGGGRMRSIKHTRDKRALYTYLEFTSVTSFHRLMETDRRTPSDTRRWSIEKRRSPHPYTQTQQSAFPTTDTTQARKSPKPNFSTRQIGRRRRRAMYK
jgi:hypothetical protein